MAKKPRRKIVVLASLVGVLTLTSGLLLYLAPPPLAGETTYDNLWAADGTDSHLTGSLFQTRVTAAQGHWKSVYVHQSNTAAGSGASSGDHFVIGNGYGSPDGQIQMTQRWNNQLSAAAPAGASSIDSDCISICVIGDFGAAAPTSNQTRRLAELVSTLQGQLGIGGDKVYLMDGVPGAAGIGRNFPSAWLRQQILP
jgi:N-acetylmuramoyl-L-alanine amidase